ncbi:hypothetical protein LCGC14_1876140 [marine sediment metagenome]|uniref:DUF5658 domain-containing protein n=1 Tax=marine sediment metagenome TaxID=412755 RepID=A0A0F9G3M1_9ZZZZ
MSNRTLFWILVALNAFDVLLTALVLDLGGTEANPYVSYFINHIGYTGMLLTKVPPIVIFGVIIYKFWNDLTWKWQKGTRLALIGMNLALFGIVAYSLINYLTYL